MPRLICILLLVVCQTGCSSLFSPDKTIATALSDYFPETEDAETTAIDRQLEDVVNEATAELRGSETDELAQSNRARQDSFVSTPADSPVNSPVKLPGGSSSWDKIERELEQTAQASPAQTEEGTSSTERTEKSLPPIVLNESTMANKGRDNGTASSLLPPVTPLIKRPFIYPHSALDLPFQSFEEATDAEDRGPMSDISWKDSLEATIAHLKEELKSLNDESAEANSLKKSLDILQSVDTDKEFVELIHKLDALQSALPPHQFNALQRVIESTDTSKSNLILQLRRAVDQVAQSAALGINNATFCMSVDGFGKYERFPTNEFRAGDEVLLYCELENFAEEKFQDENPSPMFRCRFDAQIEFQDPNDQTVFVKSFANISDESETNRKDFYLFFRFKIPTLKEGSHKLQIRFMDKIGRKNATLETPVSFTVLSNN